MQRSPVTVRPAREEDDAIIGELLVQAFVEAYSKKRPDFQIPDWRKADLRNVASKRKNYCVLAAEKDGTVVGTVTLYKHGLEACHAWIPEYSELKSLATDAALHGKGLGAPIIHASIETCRNWGSKGICIQVREGLDRLAAFYEGFGWRRDPRGDQTLPGGVKLTGYALEI